jgi:eukaryotic translation initiation factor 2C
MNITPKLIFIVVQKRSSTRLYDRGNNPPPGTVLDKGLVDPVKYDFYMVAHTARQGINFFC